VTFNSRAAMARTLRPLIEQLEPGDELIIVDNASHDCTIELVMELAPQAIVISNSVNEGFAAGCNRGADAASGELLLFLNPDAVPAPGFCEAIRRPLLESPGWAAWMGLVTTDHSGSVNTWGGVVHFTGLAWAGGAGRPVEEAPTSVRDIPFVSGACLALPRATWRREGGFPAEFFMYCEDVDLSLRLRLTGGRLGLVPAARVDHEYAFKKGKAKWRMLERNRWATIVRTYPGVLLVLLAPALLATELALIPISLAGGWGREKLLATIDTLRSLPRLLRERRAIQAKRTIHVGEFAAWLTPDLDSPYLGRAAAVGAFRTLLSLYWSAVRAVLAPTGSRDAGSTSPE
jgi:N-acetylglucosaminyl-diphospho-decaprenol L-rhamnosyltransferase